MSSPHGDIRWVPVNALVAGEQARTVHPSPHRLGVYARTIAAFGVMDPLIVQQQGDHFKVIIGFSRLSALHRARDDRGLRALARDKGIDLEHVPVRVFVGSEVQRLMLPIIVNDCHEPMNDVDVALWMQRLMDSGATTVVQQLWSPARLRHLRDLLRLPPEVQQLIKHGALDAALALKFARDIPKPHRLVRALQRLMRKVDALCRPGERKSVDTTHERKQTAMRVVNEAADMLHANAHPSAFVQGGLCVLHALQRHMRGDEVAKALEEGRCIEAPEKKKRGRPKKQ